jgi:hypothetical protein
VSDLFCSECSKPIVDGEVWITEVVNGWPWTIHRPCRDARDARALTPAAPISEEEGSEGRAKCVACGFDRERFVTLSRGVFLCDVCAEQAMVFFNRDRAPAPQPRPEESAPGMTDLMVTPESIDAFLAPPAPPPSTGDAPGPSEECHVEGCGWRWPRGSGLGCPQHPSPRAQTGTPAEIEALTGPQAEALVDRMENAKEAMDYAHARSEIVARLRSAALRREER